MRAPLRLLCLVLALGCVAAGAGTAAPASQWLMLVRTENADPAREAEFNHWYDEIDIPDVLKVPGYQRARRGVAQPGGAAPAGTGRYIALYDIRSNDIEATIAAMNRLAREMPEQGRATPLLQVTERIYYRAHGAVREGTPARVAGQRKYLQLERFARAEGADAAGFDAWYDTRVLGTALATPGVLRAARYELYRVRMDEPVPVPRYLTVFETAAADAAAAATVLEQALQRARDGSAAASAYVPGDANVFLQTKDVARPAEGR